MIKQYPQTAIIPKLAADSTLVDGIWQTSAPEEPTTFAGRYEPSTLNREVQLTDGTRSQYKGIFYMPLTAPDIQAGVDFEVVGVIKTKVLFFSRGQLNCRVYL